MPAMPLISVDLPAPLSPTRAMTSPAKARKSTSCSACTAPKCLDTPRSSSTGRSPFTCAAVSVTRLLRIEKEEGRGAGRRPSRTACTLVLRAELLVLADADLVPRQVAVLDDRRGDVRLG